MASKSGTSKTPTGGRKTPQSFSHVRPPSPKVDLSASKSKSAPSPKPKSEYLRSKGKSPSNHHERSFNNGHNNNDDCEYSVRSVFDESQLAKIKVVVEKTRLNVIDAGVDDRNHFHAVPNNHKYDPDNDMSLTYGEFAGEYIEPTPRALVTTSTDDCAVSDITADAPYMAQPVKYNNVFANNALIEADDLASLPMDVLDNMAKMIQEEKLKRSRVQGTPVVSHTATPVTEVPLAKNDIHNIPVPEAVNARKHVGRARSGGNEQMIRKNRNSPSVQNSHFPSFRSYRQGIEELGDVPLGSMDLADVTPSKSVDGVDGEVERALRGLMLTSSNSQQAIQSVTPTSHIPIGIASSAAHHSVSHPSTAGAATAAGAAATSSSAMSTLSPAGVSSHPLSRGTSTSVTGRGSGTYVGIDRMYHDSSTFTSPLHYVESPTHAAGNVIVNHGHSSSASRPVAPPRVNNLMDPLEPTTTAGPSSAQKHTKKFDSFREAKQYSDSQIDVAVVEEFQPVGVAQKEKQQHVETGATLTTPPVRPIMTRTVSAGSDLSLEAQQLDSKTVAAIVEFNTLLQRDAAESSSSAVNRRNRDLLVSPLCAFDDCASMGSLKSGGSRRSTASHTKKSGGHSGGKDKSHHPHKTSHVNYTSSTSSYLAKQINNRL